MWAFHRSNKLRIISVISLIISTANTLPINITTMLCVRTEDLIQLLREVSSKTCSWLNSQFINIPSSGCGLPQVIDWISSDWLALSVDSTALRKPEQVGDILGVRRELLSLHVGIRWFVELILISDNYSSLDRESNPRPRACQCMWQHRQH
jgi:hypothetical protein